MQRGKGVGPDVETGKGWARTSRREGGRAETVARPPP